MVSGAPDILPPYSFHGIGQKLVCWLLVYPRFSCSHVSALMGRTSYFGISLADLNTTHNIGPSYRENHRSRSYEKHNKAWFITDENRLRPVWLSPGRLLVLKLRKWCRFLASWSICRYSNAHDLIAEDAFFSRRLRDFSVRKHEFGAVVFAR